MENKEQKKLRNLRIIATNVFMGISVLVVVMILTLVAMGYSINNKGKLERSGLLRVKSIPSSAVVEINDEKQYARTEMSKMLGSGAHKIKVSKAGYDSWETDLSVEAGLLTRVDWVRLFPTEKILEKVNDYKSIKLMSVSADSRYLLLLEHDKRVGKIIDIRNDDVSYKDLNFAEILGLSKGEKIKGELKVLEWNKNSDKFLLHWKKTDESIEWILVDTTKKKEHLNLSKLLLMNFKDIKISSDTADRLWALEDKNLRLIDSTSIVTVSGVLVSGIEDFSSHGAVVGYLKSDDKGRRQIGTYKDGERGAVDIQIVDDNIKNVCVALGEYLGVKWLAYNLDNRYYVRSGEDFPSYKKIDNNLKIIAENDLDFTPAKVIASPNSRFALALSADGAAVVVDSETKYRREYISNAMHPDSLGWLGNYLIWADKGNSLTVRDFDGRNQRELDSIASGFQVALTTNNRWLYYLQDTKNGIALVRKRL